jgi:hypothetical protein
MTAKKKRATPTSTPAKRPTRRKPGARSLTEPNQATDQKLSALDAAAKVLRETGQPMSCPELIAQMAAKRYWSSPKGKTPSATLYAAIAREIRLRGEAARFVQTGPGHFAARGSNA